MKEHSKTESVPNKKARSAFQKRQAIKEKHVRMRPPCFPKVYQDFTAKVTGLEERRKLIKDAKATEVSETVHPQQCIYPQAVHPRACLPGALSLLLLLLLLMVMVMMMMVVVMVVMVSSLLYCPVARAGVYKLAICLFFADFLSLFPVQGSPLFAEEARPNISARHVP